MCYIGPLKTYQIFKISVCGVCVGYVGRVTHAQHRYGSEVDFMEWLSPLSLTQVTTPAALAVS